MHLFIENCLLPVGSGEILNGTVETVETVDGSPATETGSGDGAFLPATEEVSEWYISCKSVVHLLASFRLDGGLSWALQKAARALDEHMETASLFLVQRRRGSQGPRCSPRTCQDRGGDTAQAGSQTSPEVNTGFSAQNLTPSYCEDARPLPPFEPLQDRIRFIAGVSTVLFGNWLLHVESQLFKILDMGGCQIKTCFSPLLVAQSCRL